MFLLAIIDFDLVISIKNVFWNFHALSQDTLLNKENKTKKNLSSK